MKLLPGMFRRTRKLKVVAATIQFHHIGLEGDLWVDWTNELGGGRQRVWKVITEGEKYTTKLTKFGREEHIGGLIVSPTIQSQIFTTFLLVLTDLKPNQTSYQFEPCAPYNKLGVKKRVRVNDVIKRVT